MSDRVWEIEEPGKLRLKGTKFFIRHQGTLYHLKRDPDEENGHPLTHHSYSILSEAKYAGELRADELEEMGL